MLGLLSDYHRMAAVLHYRRSRPGLLISVSGLEACWHACTLHRLSLCAMRMAHTPAGTPAKVHDGDRMEEDLPFLTPIYAPQYWT